MRGSDARDGELTQELNPMDCVSTPRLPSWTSSWNLMGSGDDDMTPVYPKIK